MTWTWPNNPNYNPTNDHQQPLVRGVSKPIMPNKLLVLKRSQKEEAKYKVNTFKY